MSGKRRGGLSRGLDALIAGGLDVAGLGVAKPGVVADKVDTTIDFVGDIGSRLLELQLEQLQPGRYQPRRLIQEEELQSLARSIEEQGILQPIVARSLGFDRYEIIAGERRWRAAQLAKLSKVPVIIKDVPDQAALAIGLIENVQREDLNPMEEALAYERLVKEFALSHDKIAQAVGKSRTTITNILRLINLHPEARLLLEHGDIELGHAKVLLSLPMDKQGVIAREVVERDLSVRETESLVNKALTAEAGIVSEVVRVDPNIRSLEKALADKVGAQVKIVHNASGKGRLQISYNSLEELDGIIERIR